MPSWPQDCVYYFVFLHVSHCFTDGVGGSDCWQHPTKNRQHEIITSWWRLSPQKKKQNKLQDEAKSLPTKSKQTNRYTNKPNHPWTPNHFGIFNFSKRILEKKKKTHTFQSSKGSLGAPPAKREGRPTATSIAVPEERYNGWLRRLYLSHPSQNVNPFIGTSVCWVIPYRIDYCIQKFMNRNKKPDSSSTSIC